MTEAIFGLIGVVVGATVTGFIDWRNQRAERKANVRAATRLVIYELMIAESAANSAAAAIRWQHLPTAGRSALAAWADLRSVLARELSEDQWANLRVGFASLHVLLAGSEHRAPSDPLSEKAQEIVPVIAQDLRRARHGLHGGKLDAAPVEIEDAE